jgi:hypothetical protein
MIETSPLGETPSMPKPNRRQRLRKRASLSRPFPRADNFAAIHTSSEAAARSTA